MLPTHSESVWAPRSPSPRRPLPDRADVVVIGAGVAGLCAAVRLAITGLDVVILDAHQVAAGATGRSSAKVSVLHALHASEIARRDGDEMAQLYIAANRSGFDWIAGQVEHHGIACDWEPRSAVTYVTQRSNAHRVSTEQRILETAGVDARRITAALPFATAAAVAVPDQAQFDPVAFLAGLRLQFENDGGTLHTGVRATRVVDGRDGATVRTDAGSIECRWVVAATGLPFLDRGLFFARAEPQTSYTIAVETEADHPDGMFLSADGPTRSLRTARTPDDVSVLLVGGEGHKTGQGGDTTVNYRRLARWADEMFGVRRVTHRFSTQDYITPDQRPFVGPLRAGATSVLVATGFNKWGFTNAAAGAEIIAATVSHATAPKWATVMATDRVGMSGARDLVEANANVAKHMIGGWAAAATRPRRPPEPGHGHATRRGLSVVAESSNEHGVRCTVTGLCTHLGAPVAWNPAEQTWDCPLHGSRFQRTGELLHGPAVDDLEQPRR